MIRYKQAMALHREEMLPILLGYFGYLTLVYELQRLFTDAQEEGALRAWELQIL